MISSRFSVAQLLAGARLIAVDEVGRRHAFLALELHFEQFQSASAATTDNQVTILHKNFSRRQRALDRLRRPDVEILSAKAGECARARAGIRAGDSDFLSGALKIDPAIFFLQDRAPAWLWHDPAVRG